MGHHLCMARGSGLGYIYGERTKGGHLEKTRASGLGYIYGEAETGGSFFVTIRLRTMY